MTLHILVEGPSGRAFLGPWVRRLLRVAEVKIHPHQGKGRIPAKPEARPDPNRRGLLDQLPAKLRGFSDGTPQPDGVLVLVDADVDDCKELSESISALAQRFAPELPFAVRIAVEETEAFYLGDLNALERVFPSADMARARDYVPDSICGTWQLFGEIIGDDSANKVAWAEAMGPTTTIDPARSRSPSFRALIHGLHRLLARSQTPAKKKRRNRHPPRTPQDTTRRR